MTRTSDGLGYFHYNQNVNMYIQVLSFEKMLQDAKKRNAILFDKLNLIGSAGVGRRSASRFLAAGELDAVGQQELERGCVFVYLPATNRVVIDINSVRLPGTNAWNNGDKAENAITLLHELGHAFEFL